MLRSTASRVAIRAVRVGGGGRGVIPTPPQCRIPTAHSTTQRTLFVDGSHGIPEPEMTPLETIILDCTAWFVAFALIYVPTRSHPVVDNEADERSDAAATTTRTEYWRQTRRTRRVGGRTEGSRSTNDRNPSTTTDDSVDN
jgi:hypothetical protein